MSRSRLRATQWVGVVAGVLLLGAAANLTVDPVLHALCLRDTPAQRVELLASLPEARWTPPGAIETDVNKGTYSGDAAYERRLRLRGTQAEASEVFRRRLLAHGWELTKRDPIYDLYVKRVQGRATEFVVNVRTPGQIAANLSIRVDRITC